MNGILYFYEKLIGTVVDFFFLTFSCLVLFSLAFNIHKLTFYLKTFYQNFLVLNQYTGSINTVCIENAF